MPNILEIRVAQFLKTLLGDGTFAALRQVTGKREGTLCKLINHYYSPTLRDLVILADYAKRPPIEILFPDEAAFLKKHNYKPGDGNHNGDHDSNDSGNGSKPRKSAGRCHVC